eukprot:scaffold1724_cov341-Pavlova_lutheri.AAC.46
MASSSDAQASRIASRRTDVCDPGGKNGKGSPHKRSQALALQRITVPVATPSGTDPGCPSWKTERTVGLYCP